MGSPSGTKSIRLRETEEHNREKLHHSLDLTAGSNISQEIVLITSAALYNIDRARLDNCGIAGKKIIVDWPTGQASIISHSSSGRPLSHTIHVSSREPLPLPVREECW